MKKNLSLWTLLISVLWTTTASANIIFPALFVSKARWQSVPLVIISVIIEACLYKFFIKGITSAKALWVSIVVNAASAMVGASILTFAMFFWQVFFDMLSGGGTFSLPSLIANYIIMYLVSSLMELFAIRIIFGYPLRSLWVPVFVGNAITYLMVLFYKFPQDLWVVGEMLGIV